MRYEEYKETGYRFCPSLPASWNTKSGRFCFEENKKKNTDLTEKTLLQFTYGSIVRKKNQEITKDDESIIAKYTVVQPFDIMVNGLNLNYDFVSQRIGLVCEPGVITSAYLALRCHDVYNPYYANYMLKALDAQKVFHGMGSGVRLTLGYPEFSKIKFPVPPREEQDQIVRYLDWKVSCINKLIHGYQRQIKLLEERRQTIINLIVTQGIDKSVAMKNSGIEYIGEIPFNWHVTKMRTVFSERNTKVSDKDYPALSVGKMGVTPQLDSAVKTDNGDNRKLICKGDFAINSRSDRKGASGISQYDGSASLIITVLKPHSELNSKFYHYLLRSHYFVEEFYRNGHGLVSDLWTTKWSEMRNIYIPIPPREVQDEIIKFIEIHERNYKKAIESTEKQIALLKEYRTRLISDVVTGQMDVRNIEIPEFEAEVDFEADAGNETDEDDYTMNEEATTDE